ncbi:MAG: hypothetical protein M3Q84_04425 [Actinomycetota bacterium]|nr:hypothetical protein [Actinomycetota bacterium]
MATVRRPAPYWPSGPASLAVNSYETLVADGVAADRMVVRRMPGLEPVREITTPPVPPRSSRLAATPEPDKLGLVVEGRPDVTVLEMAAECGCRPRPPTSRSAHEFGWPH